MKLTTFWCIEQYSLIEEQSGQLLGDYTMPHPRRLSATLKPWDDVLTVVKMLTVVFSTVTLCSFEDDSRLGYGAMLSR
jgi:hypothetical protein